MKKFSLTEKIIGLIVVISIAFTIGGIYMKILLKDLEMPVQKQEVKQEQKVGGITTADRQNVIGQTHTFLSHFKEGRKLNDGEFTSVTDWFFNNDFLENTFPSEKSKLFGIYGYGKLTHSYSAGNGIEQEGAIKEYEIADIESDNVNKTITIYIRMNALEQNTVHWIEWRNLPVEGWKINSVSFDGNIDALSAPLSPKKGGVNNAN